MSLFLPYAAVGLLCGLGYAAHLIWTCFASVDLNEKDELFFFIVLLLGTVFVITVIWPIFVTLVIIRLIVELLPIKTKI